MTQSNYINFGDGLPQGDSFLNNPRIGQGFRRTDMSYQDFVWNGLAWDPIPAGSAGELATPQDFSIGGGGITAPVVSFDGTGPVVLNASIDDGSIDTDKLGGDITTAGKDMLAAADAQAQRVLLRSACMVRKSVDQVGADYNPAVVVAWDTEVYDIGGWHDSTNNTRLTVPAGVTMVNVFGAIRIFNFTAGSDYFILLNKNGSAAYDGSVVFRSTSPAALTSVVAHVAALGIPVAAGDYFELLLQATGDDSVDIDATRSSFVIQAC